MHLEPFSWLITPQSIISWYISCPSLVRSPIPANIDSLPSSLPILLISSYIKTVFPEPPPPKIPILSPQAYGAIKSTTLIPVFNIYVYYLCETNGGGSLCIGNLYLHSIGPRLSTGSPKINIRNKIEILIKTDFDLTKRIDS